MGGGGGGGGMGKLLQSLQGAQQGAQGGQGGIGGMFGRIGQAFGQAGMGGQQSPLQPRPSPFGNPGGFMGQGGLGSRLPVKLLGNPGGFMGRPGPGDRQMRPGIQRPGMPMPNNPGMLGINSTMNQKIPQLGGGYMGPPPQFGGSIPPSPISSAYGQKGSKYGLHRPRPGGFGGGGGGQWGV